MQCMDRVHEYCLAWRELIWSSGYLDERDHNWSCAVGSPSIPNAFTYTGSKVCLDKPITCIQI